MSGNNSGWNRPASNQPTVKKGGAKAPSKVKGVVAGLVTVCALGALCLWFFSGGDDAPKAKAEKERGRIKEVTPAAAPTNKVVEATAKPKKKEMPTHRDERGILRYETGQRAPDPTRPRRPPLTSAMTERRIFKYASERFIADLVDSIPGEKRFFTPDYYDLEDDFLASLKEEIVINDDDMQCDKEIKQAMIEVRADLKKRMDAGEKLGDILTEASKELQRLGEYSDQLQEEVRRAIKDGNLSKNGEPFSENDIKDLVGAANKMLEEKGCNPISTDQMIISNIRLHADQLGWTSDERKAAINAFREKRRAERKAEKEQSQATQQKE